MGQYAVQNGGRAYILLCDDTERDYGDPEEAAKTAEQCAALGFETISMRDDFQTVYADNITMNDAEMPEPAIETENEALEPAA